MSTNLILEDGSSERKHRRHLSGLLKTKTGTLRIASAYVTDRELLTNASDRERRLLISLSPMDVASGATSISTLEALIKSGVECRTLSERPRLHAKVYIFGTSCAVISSANLTRSAFDSNIEVGTETGADETDRLIAWFDGLWDKGIPLTLSCLSKLEKDITPIRKELEKIKKKIKAKLKNAGIRETPTGLTDSLSDLFSKADRYFVCNSDRRQGERTNAGGFLLEEEMCTRGFAAAWETFAHSGHMKEVKRGDGIFMFAKSVGIIAVGIAKGGCETLAPNNSDRIRNVTQEGNDTIEWRIPVHWLEWRDDANAYRWKSNRTVTFWEATAGIDFREKVKMHFLGNI